METKTLVEEVGAVTERARKLRERVRDVLNRMCPEADPPFASEESDLVLRAVVEHLGIDYEMIEGVTGARDIVRNEIADGRIVADDRGDCDRTAVALATLLEAVEDR